MIESALTPDVVLLVDDHADIRESLGELLQEEGFRVALAADGSEALRYLRQNRAPCLILLDLMMPVMNGYEFRLRQREDPELARIPVAIISGREDAQQNALELQAVGCFMKPVDLDALLGTVSAYCPCSPGGTPC
jgi:CheY-like chemotaxis protein